MPIPGSLTTITVTSADMAIDGTPLTGSVVFETDQPIMDSAGSVKFLGPATRLVFHGTMKPIVLPCTDNSGLNPTGFMYKVTETLNGVAQTPYWVSLPSTLGATVDLSALTPAGTAPSLSSFAASNTWAGTNTFQGETIVPTPVNASDAATKAYVDSHVSGRYLVAPSIYAPGSAVTMSTTSATLAAVSSANVNTGSFAAPSSGAVIVTASFVTQMTANDASSFALAAHGTVTPVVGNVVTGESNSLSNLLPLTLQFYVTGLTSGTSYNFDLLYANAGAGTLRVIAVGQSSTTPTATTGGPIIMTVQAI